MRTSGRHLSIHAAPKFNVLFGCIVSMAAVMLKTLHRTQIRCMALSVPLCLPTTLCRGVRFEPMSVELHQTGTFEGRSTD